MPNYKPKLPDVRKATKWMVPEAMRRNHLLVVTGGEPVNLYLPDGVQDEADYDNIRQTYRSKDIKYKLYLNRYQDKITNARLYTNETDRVPSCLVAFPDNPDEESQREEGIVLVNVVRAWTLWDPVVPTRGAIIERHHGLQQNEYWLVEDVNYSHFVNYPKTDNILMHQEFKLGIITPGAESFDVSNLPSLYDTLALFKNDLDVEIDNFTATGDYELLPNEQALRVDGTTNLTIPGTWSNHHFAVKVTPTTSSGKIVVSWGAWNNATKPQFVLDVANQKIQILLNSTNLSKEKSVTLTPNVEYDFRVSIQGARAKVYLNKEVVLTFNWTFKSLYKTIKPLSSTTVTINVPTNNAPFLLRKMYMMEHI